MKRRERGGAKHVVATEASPLHLISRHASSFSFSKTEQAKRDFLKRLGSDLQRNEVVPTYKGAYSLPKPKEVKTTAEDFYSTMEVRSWGSGSHGQLGLGDDRHRATPELVLALYRITSDLGRVQLCCGDLLTTAINELGHVYVWGRLPLDASQNIKVPERVTGLDNVVVRSMSCGPGHMALVSDDGAVYTWGRGQSGRLGHGDDHNAYTPRQIKSTFVLHSIYIRQVACGEEHTLFLATDGALFSCGGGRAGQLGIGSYVNCCEEPCRVPLPPDTTFVHIACGMNHSAGVVDSGAVYTWGWGEQGRLGHGNEESHPSVKCVEGLRHVKVTTLSCGGAHSLALSSCKKVFAWGWGSFGQLGLGSCHDALVPKPIKALEHVHVIACGFGHSAAVTDTGVLYMWGFGEEGQIGAGDERNHDSPQMVWTVPVKSKPVDPPNVLHISLGKAHSMAVALLSMHQDRRRRLNPDTVRHAAISLQCFVRATVARIKDKQAQDDVTAAFALRREQEVDQFQDAANREADATAREAQAQEFADMQKRQVEITAATCLQRMLRGWLARLNFKVRWKQYQDERAEAETAARERAAFLALEEREAFRMATDEVATSFVRDVLIEVHANEERQVEIRWRAEDSIAQANLHRETQLKLEQEELERRNAVQELARHQRELRRQEGIEAAEAEHRARRDREIADTKAKLQARKLQAAAAAVGQPTTKTSKQSSERRRRLRDKLRQKAADEINISREKRDKLRAELADRRKVVDEKLQEQQQLAAKLELARHHRIFRNSLKETPVVPRPTAAFQVRASFIAETYRVLPGDPKPHYVLDPNAAAAVHFEVAPAAAAVPTNHPRKSKVRIFRELQRSKSSSDGTRPEQSAMPTGGNNSGDV
ncbi:hypothetical protein, variant [Aphanomyces astaci]|uniref:RCC1-like domain-containing protein n=1 Tax=Aphanomyces astaci TaxID=112090 RepID=W4GX26_APHAT|nr:hypothetical protein, variant [Aphanomyces astaci]ETV83549.1 hypothetical protein, variant [Aphanomyces astaci]|eukprot:XP_009826979.1 hypothetical protein, variant [Aphanomyces astaci]